MKNREFKFRAWNPVDKVMGQPFTLRDLLSCYHEADQIDQEGIVYMQFTGLLDKNGKEIYEGDILHKYGPDFVSEEYERWQESGYEGPKPPDIVVKKDFCTLRRFRLWLEHECFGYEGEDLEDSEDWEIIGDIYQNPELLEK